MSDSASSTTGATKPAGPQPMVPKNEGNPALRMMGLPRLRAKLPSRNWLIFLSVVGSWTAAVVYDRGQKRKAQQRWCDAVSHLSQEPLSTMQMPRRITVFLAAPPGDGLLAARDYFQEYVKPVLVAAAIDWDVVEGRKEGDVRAKLAERIRKSRRRDGEKSMVASEKPKEEDLVEEIKQKAGIRSSDERDGDLVIGRHTWKEYIRGLHEGWLAPLDAPPEREPEPEPEAALQPDGPEKNAPPPQSLSLPEEVPPTTMLKSHSSDDSSVSLSPPTESPQPPEEEKHAPRPKPTPTPPYIAPSDYPSLPLPPSLPSSFPPCIPLPFPHLLGFFNTPIRVYRFLNHRHIADSTGSIVATFILSPSGRPFAHEEASLSTTNGNLDDVTLQSSLQDREAVPATVTYTQSWEQSSSLSDEEHDWHKSARAPNKEGEERERVWQEPVSIDDRIGCRMRTTSSPPSSSLPSSPATMAVPGPSDLLGSAVANVVGGVLEGANGGTDTLAPGDVAGKDASQAGHRSKDWRGGADRMERLSWGTWLGQAAGLGEKKPRGCKGWEQGLVGRGDE